MFHTLLVSPLLPTSINLADWFVKFRDWSSGKYVGEYSLLNPTAEIRNSEPGGFSGEIALGQKRRGSTTLGITRDQFIPFATHYELWRQSSGNGVCISAGMLASINLQKNRDTVLVAGKDWIHYLQRRLYPFDPAAYLAGGWTRWPRRWPDIRGTHGPAQSSSPVDVSIVVRQLIQTITREEPTEEPPIGYTWPASQNADVFGAIPITQNIPLTGNTVRYVIYPGDPTTIYDHITRLSEMTEKGFEFDIGPISMEFRLWSPRRNHTQTIPVYTFRATDDEESGAMTEFDWTNDGPEGTYLVGLGAGEHKAGATWTTERNVTEFSRLDKAYDFGQIPNTDMLLQMLQDQDDLHPQKKLAIQLLNPEFLSLNFYTGDRPRALLGARIRVVHDFAPLHTVDAQFWINNITWNVDDSTNEWVDLEIQQDYEP